MPLLAPLMVKLIKSKGSFSVTFLVLSKRVTWPRTPWDSLPHSRLYRPSLQPVWSIVCSTLYLTFVPAQVLLFHLCHPEAQALMLRRRVLRITLCRGTWLPSSAPLLASGSISVTLPQPPVLALLAAPERGTWVF